MIWFDISTQIICSELTFGPCHRLMHMPHLGISILSVVMDVRVCVKSSCDVCTCLTNMLKLTVNK